MLPEVESILSRENRCLINHRLFTLDRLRNIFKIVCCGGAVDRQVTCPGVNVALPDSSLLILCERRHLEELRSLSGCGVFRAQQVKDDHNDLCEQVYELKCSMRYCHQISFFRFYL